jgi:signal transduction histidine kinase
VADTRGLSAEEARRAKLGGWVLAGLIVAWFLGLSLFAHQKLMGGNWHGPLMAALSLGIAYVAFVWLRDIVPVKPVTGGIWVWYAFCGAVVAATIGMSRTVGTLPSAFAAAGVLGAYLVMHAPRPATSPLRRLLAAFVLALLPLGWLAHDYWQALDKSARMSESTYHTKLRRATQKAVTESQEAISRTLKERLADLDDVDDPDERLKDIADDDLVQLAVREDGLPRRQVHLKSRIKRVHKLGVGNAKISYDEARDVAWESLPARTREVVAQELAAARGGKDTRGTGPGDGAFDLTTDESGEIRSVYRFDSGAYFVVGRRSEATGRTWLLLLDQDEVARLGQRNLEREGLEDQVVLASGKDASDRGVVLMSGDQLPKYLGLLTLIELPGAFKEAQDRAKQGQFFTTVWFGTLLLWALGALGRLYRTAREDVALAEMKANFVSAISHELKTPLAMIKMYSEMLSLGMVGEGKKAEDYHGIIIHESDRLTRLIDNVLDFSKIQKGTKTYLFEPVDLAEAVAGAMRTMDPVFEREQVDVSTAATPGLGVMADRDALQQALLNLLSNAVKYGGKKVDVRVERRGKTVEIAVSDAGPGIPRAEQAKIFRPFYRMGREEERTAQGTGLGLALVAEIMRAHGGSATVSSRPGTGATFKLVFPQDRIRPHDRVVQNPVQSVTTGRDQIRKLES